MLLVHVPSREGTLVKGPQPGNLLFVTPQRTEVERHGINEAKPFVPDIGNQQIAVILRRSLTEREVVVHARKREAESPELLDIHFTAMVYLPSDAAAGSSASRSTSSFVRT